MASKREREKKQRRVVSAKDWADKQESGFSTGALKIPKDKEYFYLKKSGRYRIDILPYEVKHSTADAEEGSLFWTKKFFTHRRIGPEEKDYCCLAKNFGKPCPVCEHVNKLRRDGADDDTINSLKAKQRQLWNIINLADPDKGVQVWETGFYMSFGEMLKDKILASDEEDGYNSFADLEDGFTLKLLVKDAKFKGISYREVANIEFSRRKEAYDESVLDDDVVCLDDCLVELTYDQLKNILLQTGAGGDEEDEEESNGKPRGKKPGRKPVAEDEDDEEEGTDEDEDEEQEEDEEEEPAPKKGKKPAPRGKKPAQNEDGDEETEEEEESGDDEDEDDWEDETNEDEDEQEEEEEEPAPKKGKKPTGKTPPRKGGR